MKKEDKIENCTQLNFDEQLGLNTKEIAERADGSNFTPKRKGEVKFNDAGQPINTNTGYSSADLKELYEEDENEKA